MNVNTITIAPEEAERKLDQYKRLAEKKRTKEDDKLEALYRSVRAGARVLDIAQAFKQAGLNEQLQPKLAIARADFKRVWCFRNPYLRRYTHSENTVGFGPNVQWDRQASAQNVILPNETFPQFGAERGSSWSRISSPVPHIPPEARPKFGLHNYHILFEVEKWEQYPVDPFLLRRIAGTLYVVEAEWQLTELEASLLSAMQT